MPRRKILRMYATELPIFMDLVKMLHEHPVLKDSDFTTLELVAKKRNPDPRIVDVEQYISRLERFIRNNGNRNVNKQDLCKILKISRPTLNKWIDEEFISKGKMKQFYAGHQSFDLEIVLKELKRQQERK